MLFDRLMRYLIAGHREFYMEYCRVLLDLNRVAEKKNSFLRRSARPRICIEWDHLKFSTFRIQQRIYSTTFNVNTWDQTATFLPFDAYQESHVHHSISSCLYLIFFYHCSSVSASLTSTKKLTRSIATKMNDRERRYCCSCRRI